MYHSGTLFPMLHWSGYLFVSTASILSFPNCVTVMQFGWDWPSLQGWSLRSIIQLAQPHPPMQYQTKLWIVNNPNLKQQMYAILLKTTLVQVGSEWSTGLLYKSVEYSCKSYNCCIYFATRRKKSLRTITTHGGEQSWKNNRKIELGAS